MIEEIGNFKGYQTAGDLYTNPGATSAMNINIDDQGAIEKCESYDLVIPDHWGITAISSSGTDTVLTVSGGTSGVVASGAIVLYDVSDSNVNEITKYKAWKIKDYTATKIVLASANTSSIDFSFNDIYSNILNSRQNAGSYPSTINNRSIFMGNTAATDTSFSTLDIDKIYFSCWFNYTGGISGSIFRLKKDNNNQIAATYGAGSVAVFALLGGNLYVWSDIVSVGVHNIMVATDNTSYIKFYFDGSLVQTDSTSWTSFKPTSLEVSSDAYTYDFCALDKAALGTLSYTDDQIATLIYNNTYYRNNTFAFTYEIGAFSAKADKSMLNLAGFAAAGGTSVNDITCQGAIYRSDGYLYAFLSNGTNSYLCKTVTTATSWNYVESTPTAFTTTYPAWFKEYGSDLIFTKNQYLSGIGGTLTLSGTAIAPYGESNNPTGKVIEVHNDRLWVGNVTKLSSEAYTGKSHLFVSKLFPEKDDTTVTVSGIAFGSGLATITATSHPFSIDDQVFINGITFSATAAGYDDFNGHFYTVTGKATNSYVVEYQNNNSLVWSSGGTATINGNTWGVAATVYDDAVIGAGEIKCDDNESDEVVQLKSAFGNLNILRQNSIYIFTGAIESGNATLSRALNVSYGAISPHVVKTDGGLWFMAKEGLSKLEGVTVSTVRTELDNIQSLLPSTIIQKDIDSITNKSLVVLGYVNDDIQMRISDTSTYVLGLKSGYWMPRDIMLIDRFFNIAQDSYSVFKYMLFSLGGDSYYKWNYLDYTSEAYTSRYKTGYRGQGDITTLKQYRYFFSLLEGARTNSDSNTISINFYFDGKLTQTGSVSFDIKTGDNPTWIGAFDSTDTWSGTFSGTDTWSSYFGASTGIFSKYKYFLGTAKNIAIEFTHKDQSYFKIGNCAIDYDMLTVKRLY